MQRFGRRSRRARAESPPGPATQGVPARIEGMDTETEIALIFDEVITGFRPTGGAQAWFGVQADSLPTARSLVAVCRWVSCRQGYIHGCIGRWMWHYGDDSFLEVG